MSESAQREQIIDTLRKTKSAFSKYPPLVNQEQFNQIYNALQGTDLPIDATNEIFLEIDQNADGKISFEDFLEILGEFFGQSQKEVEKLLATIEDEIPSSVGSEDDSDDEFLTLDEISELKRAFQIRLSKAGKDFVDYDQLKQIILREDLYSHGKNKDLDEVLERFRGQDHITSNDFATAIYQIESRFLHPTQGDRRSRGSFMDDGSMFSFDPEDDTEEKGDGVFETTSVDSRVANEHLSQVMLLLQDVKDLLPEKSNGRALEMLEEVGKLSGLVRYDVKEVCLSANQALKQANDVKYQHHLLESEKINLENKLKQKITLMGELTQENDRIVSELQDFRNLKKNQEDMKKRHVGLDQELISLESKNTLLEVEQRTLNQEIQELKKKLEDSNSKNMDLTLQLKKIKQAQIEFDEMQVPGKDLKPIGFDDSKSMIAVDESYLLNIEALESENAELNNQMKELEDKILDYERNFKTFQIEKRQWSEEKEDLEEKVIELERCESLRNQTSELHQIQISTTESENLALKRELAKLREKHTKLELECKSHEDEIRGLKNEIEMVKLNHQMESHTDGNAFLDNFIPELEILEEESEGIGQKMLNRISLLKVKEEISRRKFGLEGGDEAPKEELSVLEMRAKELEQADEKLLEKRFGDFKQEHKQLKITLNKCKTRIRHLEASVKEKKSLIEQLRNLKDAYKQYITELENVTLPSKDQENEALKEKVTIYEAEIDKLSTELAKTRELYQLETMGEKEKLDLDKRQLEARVKKLEEIKKEAVESSVNLKGELGKLLIKNAEKEEKLETIQDERSQLENEKKMWKSHIESREEENMNLRMQLAALEDEKKSLTTNVTVGKKELLMREMVLKEVSKQRKNLESEKNKLERIVDDMEHDQEFDKVPLRSRAKSGVVELMLQHKRSSGIEGEQPVRSNKKKSSLKGMDMFTRARTNTLSKNVRKRFNNPNDFLSLVKNANVVNLLYQSNDSVLDDCFLSDKIFLIDSRDMKLERILVVSSKHVYLLYPSSLKMAKKFRPREIRNIVVPRESASLCAFNFKASEIVVETPRRTQLIVFLTQNFNVPMNVEDNLKITSEVEERTEKLEVQKQEYLSKIVKKCPNIDILKNSIKIGFIKKRSRFLKKWNQRFCALVRGGMLLYFNKMEDKVPKGIIPIYGAIIDELTEKDGKEGALTIKLSSQDQILFLCFNSDSEKQEWLDLFKEVRDEELARKDKISTKRLMQAMVMQSLFEKKGEN